MRDYELSPQEFNARLENQIYRVRAKLSELLSRISPIEKQGFQNCYLFYRKDNRFYVNLAVLSWYIPQEVGYLLRLQISEEIQNTESEWLEILLASKAQCLIFLQETTLWHTRDFFGNILSLEETKKTLEAIRPRFESKQKVKKPEFRRGYRDKGSLKLSHEHHSFWDSRKEQLDLEEKRQSRHDSLLFMLGFLGIPPG
jgi:hypothetical protein